MRSKVIEAVEEFVRKYAGIQVTDFMVRKSANLTGSFAEVLLIYMIFRENAVGLLYDRFVIDD